MEQFSAAYINREAKQINAISCEDEDESEEERDDAPQEGNRACYAAPQSEKPINDAMAGGTLDKSLVAIARQTELKYFLAKEIWLERPRS